MLVFETLNYDNLIHFLVFLQIESGENILDENSPLRPQLLTREGKRPSVFLRYREKDGERGYVRVYPGGLRYDNSLEM